MSALAASASPLRRPVAWPVGKERPPSASGSAWSRVRSVGGVRRHAEAWAPPAMARHVGRDVRPAPFAPLWTVVLRVVHRSTEATVARDAAGTVGGGHPARQADRCPRHSRRPLVRLINAARLHARSRQDVTGSTTIHRHRRWRPSSRAQPTPLPRCPGLPASLGQATPAEEAANDRWVVIGSTVSASRGAGKSSTERA